MFNTNQLTFLESFIPTMLLKGYPYYVAYTNTNTNNNYYSDVIPDLYVIFSTEEITCTSAYSYNIPENSIRFTCRTVNYSNSNNAVNTERISSSSFGGPLKVNVYEFVYTNAICTNSSIVYQPDITKEGSINNEFSVLTSFLLGSLLFYLIIKDMWHTGYRQFAKIKSKSR